MAGPQIKQQINLVIRLAALAMLVLSIMMMGAPFKIKRQGNVVPWRDNTFHPLYCEINVSDSSHQSWAGFMVFLTSLFVAASQATNKEQTWLPKVLVMILRHKKMICPILVLISMFSAMVIMTQEAYTMGRLRNYKIHECSNDEHSNEIDVNDMEERLSRLVSWFYILVIPSNVVVVLCFIQIVAFFTKWIIRISSNIEEWSAETNNEEVPQEQPSTSNDLQPPTTSLQQNSSVGLWSQSACHARQTYLPPPDCGNRCPYHTPQPPHYHQCHHPGFPIR